MKKHIFNPGPCKLPEPVLKNTANAVRELNQSGMSIMEVSHRGKDFEAVMEDAMSLLKELLDVPRGYSVLFLGGGASLQFAMIPMNFLKTKAAYLHTGTWAGNAIREARVFGRVDVLASSEDKNFTYVPKGYRIPEDADYFHITTNNTIFGTELLTDPDSPVPLIADMSSDILSRPVDVSKYAMIYGGAQKNMGPSGVTFIIIRDDMLEKVADRPIPRILKYETHLSKGSMFNTPPVVNVYAVRETLLWVKNMGGVKEMEKLAKARADMLYKTIDESRMFVGTAVPEDRSRMNICFVMKPEYKELEPDFISYAAAKGIVGIKGHRSVGGFRASCYNALELESVKLLADAMKEYERKIVK
ncbi:MAG TPA: 3-phosphoserine/phosphohydroxythreonine transaminase [Bacteroidetes bacterium]|nr:3-phosphoserine/phosphohydroxythreonine transaminase [Bacteroidota bacterium]